MSTLGVLHETCVFVLGEILILLPEGFTSLYTLVMANHARGIVNSSQATSLPNLNFVNPHSHIWKHKVIMLNVNLVNPYSHLIKTTLFKKLTHALWRLKC